MPRKPTKRTKQVGQVKSGCFGKTLVVNQSQFSKMDVPKPGPVRSRWKERGTGEKMLTFNDRRKKNGTIEDRGKAAK